VDIPTGDSLQTALARLLAAVEPMRNDDGSVQTCKHKGCPKPVTYTSSLALFPAYWMVSVTGSRPFHIGLSMELLSDRLLHLRGAILHFGERDSARDGGHYISVQLTRAGAFVIDDEKVYQTTPDKALELVCAHGKILLFGPAPGSAELPECVRRAVCDAAMLMQDVDDHLPRPATKVSQVKTPRADSCTGPAGRTLVAPDATPARMEDVPAVPVHREHDLDHMALRRVPDGQVESLRRALLELNISDTRCDETAGGLGLLFPRVAKTDLRHTSMQDLEREVEAAERDPACMRSPGTLQGPNLPWFAVVILSGPALALFTHEGKSGRRHVNTDEVERLFGPMVLRCVYRPARRARMTQGGLVGALDPTLVLELPSEQALTRLCRAVASLPAQGPHRLRLRELGRELIPNSELYPTERSRRCPARVTLKNVPAPGATAAVALAKRLVLDLLNRGRPLDEAEVFMVGGSASQSGGPSSRSWTVFLPLLDPAVAQQVVAGLHQRVVNKFTIMAYGAGPLAHCALCGRRGHLQEECRPFTLLLFKRDGVPWTQPEIDGHNKGLQALHFKRGYGGEGPSSLLILFFGSEQNLTSAVLSVVELMRSGSPHPYATVPRFTEGFCPRGCNRCLWPRTRGNVHTAATCPGTRLLPAALPVRITIGPEGFAEIGRGGAAEPRSASIDPPTTPTDRATTPMLPPSGAMAVRSVTPGRTALTQAEAEVVAPATSAHNGSVPPPPATSPLLPLVTCTPLGPTPSSRSAPAVNSSDTSARPRRTITPSRKGAEAIADRADSASSAGAKRLLELESSSEAGTDQQRLEPLLRTPKKKTRKRT
jgi:hypothetical protein